MGELQKRDVSARACVCRSGSLVAFRVSHGSFAHPTSFAAYFLNSSQYFSLDILFASLPYNRLKVPMIGLNYFLRKSKKKNGSRVVLHCHLRYCLCSRTQAWCENERFLCHIQMVHSPLTTSEHNYKVLLQLRNPTLRAELLIFSSVVCLQFTLPWIISAGLLPSYPVPVVGAWVGEAIK